MEYGPPITRRGFSASLAAAGCLAMLGCSKGAQSQPSAAQADAPAAAPAQARQMIVYRDPSCPCCEKWAAMAREAGYVVRVIDHPDMPAIKAQYGVPEDLRSCHTAIVGNYAFEGHVPFEHVAKLLRERPEGILGLAVAGMPAGSPGMEVPGGETEPFEVMAFGKDRQPARFVV
jgi:hypothetical protein